MATNRKVYHVLPKGENVWKAENIATKDVVFEGELKEEVVEQIKKKARQEEPSQVVVHGLNGSIQYERTYGSDPIKYEG